MGWSAGGHLALLYAYKERRCRQSGNNCDGCALENSCNNIVVGVGQHPIKLVISEAGPTNFLLKDGTGNPISPDKNVCNLVGITDNSADNTKLSNASPITYADNNSPYTILVYGDGVSPNTGNISYQGNAGDGVVAYSQATSLAAQLDASYYTLFTFNGVGHNTFGEGETVYPGATSDMIKEYYSCDDVNKPGLKQLIDIYLLGNTNTNN